MKIKAAENSINLMDKIKITNTKESIEEIKKIIDRIPIPFSSQEKYDIEKYKRISSELIATAYNGDELTSTSIHVVFKVLPFMKEGNETGISLENASILYKALYIKNRETKNIFFRKLKKIFNFFFSSIKELIFYHKINRLIEKSENRTQILLRMSIISNIIDRYKDKDLFPLHLNDALIFKDNFFTKIDPKILSLDMSSISMSCPLFGLMNKELIYFAKEKISSPEDERRIYERINKIISNLLDDKKAVQDKINSIFD